MIRDLESNLEHAASRIWDAVVVGAGPAGAMAALQLARSGAAVLIVERARFPRVKVCGSCFGRAALHALARVGLGDLLDANGARAFDCLQVNSGGRRLPLALPEGRALSRSAFDHAMLRAAAAAGAHTQTGVHAELQPASADSPTRALQLRRGRESIEVQAQIVLDCGGLGGDLQRNETQSTVAISRGAPIGVGAIADGAAAIELAQGQPLLANAIHMSCARGGYVGMVRIEGEALAIAAAIRPSFLRAHGSPLRAITAILAAAGVRGGAALETLAWRGTPALTRRRTGPGAHRVFSVGDAAGYVEPFTGDGIAVALASAQAVAPLVICAIERWDARLSHRWATQQRSLCARRQMLCRCVSQILKRPLLSRAAMAVLTKVPRLARPTLESLARPIG